MQILILYNSCQDVNIPHYWRGLSKSARIPSGVSAVHGYPLRVLCYAVRVYASCAAVMPCACGARHAMGHSVLNVKQTLHTKVIHTPNLSTTLFHTLSTTLSTTCFCILRTITYSIENYIISIWQAIAGYLYHIALHALLHNARKSCALCYRACNLQRAVYGDFSACHALLSAFKNVYSFSRRSTMPL